MKKSRIILISGLVLLGALIGFFFNVETSPTKEGVASACSKFLTSTEAYLNSYLEDYVDEVEFRELEKSMLLEASIAASYVDNFSDLDSSYSTLANLLNEAAKAPNGAALDPILNELIPQCQKVFEEVKKS